MERKGVVGIIYDPSTMFYLILHKNLPESKGWEFLKALIGGDSEVAMKDTIDHIIGLKKYKFVKKLDWTYTIHEGEHQTINDIFLIATSMNTPVRLVYDINKINTYLWAKESNVMEKLLPDHKKILEKATLEIPKE